MGGRTPIGESVRASEAVSRDPFRLPHSRLLSGPRLIRVLALCTLFFNVLGWPLACLGPGTAFCALRGSWWGPDSPEHEPFVPRKSLCMPLLTYWVIFGVQTVKDRASRRRMDERACQAASGGCAGVRRARQLAVNGRPDARSSQSRTPARTGAGRPKSTESYTEYLGITVFALVGLFRLSTDFRFRATTAALLLKMAP